MPKNIKNIVIIIGFVFLTIIGFAIFPKEETIEIKEKEEMEDYIFVHIEGEIKKPGLIKVKYGIRLYELIEEAGGATEEADLSRVNLSSILSDEQKIVIPKKVLKYENGEISGVDGGLININTASKEKLMELDGIGEGTALKIIKYRETNGYFNSIEDIKNVPGIGENKFNGLKENITI